MNDFDPDSARHGGIGGQPANWPDPAPGWPVPPQGPPKKRGIFSRRRNIVITAN